MRATTSANVFIRPRSTAGTVDDGKLMNLSTQGFTKVRKFIAGEALEVGECVALDFAGVQTLISTAAIAGTESLANSVAGVLLTVKKTAAVTAGAKGFIGVAMETVASGEELWVCVGGFCPFVQSAGSVADGDYLVPAAAGEMILYAAGTHTACSDKGFALSDDADQGSDPDEVGCAAWLYPTAP